MHVIIMYKFNVTLYFIINNYIYNIQMAVLSEYTSSEIDFRFNEIEIQDKSRTGTYFVYL